QAEREIRIGINRVERRSLDVRGSRFIDLTAALEHSSQVVVRLGAFRPALNAVAVRLDRLFTLSARPQRESKAVLRRLVVGIQRKRPLELCFGLTKLLQLQQGESETVMRGGTRRLKGDRALQRRNRFPRVSRLEQRRSQLALAVEMIRSALR